MKTKNEKLLDQIMGQVKLKNPFENKFNKLLEERVKLLLERAPIAELMDATAEIARFELENFSSGPIEYSLESIPIIDAYIDKHGKKLREKEDDCSLVAVWFGAFLGRVLINEFNGAWQHIEDSDWVAHYLFGKVKFDNNLFANPGIRILNSIEGIPHDNVVAYVNALSQLVQVKNPFNDADTEGTKENSTKK